ncbi:hypothetical protein AB0870_04195 [Microbacterium proteolyticum]|uniref:hypothetical protein n=1 Tax=Microbacterium proteolyticum TaxID=1572644 RepID=UPI0024179230|nr:hypothetical protein [Microbacterium proteolyticum]
MTTPTMRRTFPVIARTPAIAVGFFVALFFLAWFRLSGAERGTMWAEDASIFSARALDPSQLTLGIFTPYAGYTHAVPQAIASFVWWAIPTSDVAVAFTAASCAVAAGVGVLIYFLTGHWRLHPAARVALGSVSVLAPGLAYEVLGNLANIHWLLLWLTPFLFLARPRSWVSSVLLGIVAFFTVATEIQSAVFSPLLIWRLRDRRRWPIIVGAAAGAAFQASAYLQSTGGRGAGHPSLSTLVDGYFLQAPLVALTGTGQGASALVGYSGWDIAYLSIVPFVIGAVWFILNRRRPAALVVVALFGASVAIWAAGFWLNFFPQFDFSTMDPGTLKGGVPLLRYSIVPIMLLWALIALGAGSARDRRLGAKGIATLLLMASVFAFSYRVDDHSAREMGPTWSPEIGRAEVQCDIGTTEDVVIPVAPATWSVEVPCDEVE